MRIQKMIAAFSITLALAFVATNDVAAQRRLPKINKRALLDSLSPEQKTELRQRMRARYDSLPPAQQEKIKTQWKNRVDSLSPAEKKKLRQQLGRNKPAGGSR